MACKVGNREYTGKREILEDLYRIPQNCLLFNFDPSHPLRRIALRFRDTLDLLEHKIPDIDVPPMDHITPVTPHWCQEVKEGHGQGPHQESPGYMCIFFEFDPEKYRRNPACSQLRYETIDELKEHIKTHVLPYSCERDCGYGTWTKEAYMDHTCEDLHMKTLPLVKALKRAVLVELSRPDLSVEEIRSMVFGTHDGKFQKYVGVTENAISALVLSYTGIEEQRIKREKAKAQKGKVTMLNFTHLGLQVTEKDATAHSPPSVADQSDVSAIPSQADKTNPGPPPE